MKFNEWLDTFLEEKGIDVEMHSFDVESPHSGLNIVELGVVIEGCKTTSEQQQAGIKKQIVALDFVNADVMDFFEFLAKSLVSQRDMINYGL